LRCNSTAATKWKAGRSFAFVLMPEIGSNGAAQLTCYCVNEIPNVSTRAAGIHIHAQPLQIY
jgi:hypothetical protein